MIHSISLLEDAVTFRMILSAGEVLCFLLLGFVGRKLAGCAGTWPVAGKGKCIFK